MIGIVDFFHSIWLICRYGRRFQLQLEMVGNWKLFEINLKYELNAIGLSTWKVLLRKVNVNTRKNIGGSPAEYSQPTITVWVSCKQVASPSVWHCYHYAVECFDVLFYFRPLLPQPWHVMIKSHNASLDPQLLLTM